MGPKSKWAPNETVAHELKHNSRWGRAYVRKKNQDNDVVGLEEWLVRGERERRNIFLLLVSGVESRRGRLFCCLLNREPCW